MDTLSIGTALLAWRREFSQPVALLDNDLLALYEYKRSLQLRRMPRLLGPIRAEIAEGATHFREALRLAVHRFATH